MRGPPKIYLDPAPDYQVEPGGSLNITCAAVAYPFPQIFWEKGQTETQTNGANGGVAKSEQVLIIKEVSRERGRRHRREHGTKMSCSLTHCQIYKSTEFTCHARNQLGEVSRKVRVEVTGPGSAPVLRELSAGRYKASRTNPTRPPSPTPPDHPSTFTGNPRTC